MAVLRRESNRQVLTLVNFGQKTLSFKSAPSLSRRFGYYSFLKILAQGLPNVITALNVNRNSGHIQQRCKPVVSKENNGIKLAWLQCDHSHYLHYQIQSNFRSCCECGRSIPPMSSTFKNESNHYWILFSLQKEIIGHFHSLWFPRKGAPIAIFHTLRLTEAMFESDVT